MAAFAARQPQLRQRVAALLQLVDMQLLQVAGGPAAGGSAAAGAHSEEAHSTALPVWRPPAGAAPAGPPRPTEAVPGITTPASQPSAPPSAPAPGLSTVAALINSKLARSSLSASLDGWDTSSSSSSAATGLPGKQTGGQRSSAFVAWAVSLLDQASRHGAIYTIMEAMELLLTEDKIAALEAFSNAAVTEVRQGMSVWAECRCLQRAWEVYDTLHRGSHVCAPPIQPDRPHARSGTLNDVRDVLPPSACRAWSRWPGCPPPSLPVARTCPSATAPPARCFHTLLSICAVYSRAC